ncbi:Oxidoreductase OXR1 [Fusarium oxysporum f. sp. albedinis]|nr:Uncharacterized protein HZ326_23727 [Fusarium oxysporum f. sp. albedinis]KAJ0135122.1 Oxidoreductase OXR1 [Fusarium oxysporum f. sp. albedinis]
MVYELQLIGSEVGACVAAHCKTIYPESSLLYSTTARASDISISARLVAGLINSVSRRHVGGQKEQVSNLVEFFLRRSRREWTGVVVSLGWTKQVNEIARCGKPEHNLRMSERDI